MTEKRIAKELADLQRNPPDTFSAVRTDKDDLYRCTAQVVGPPETPYSQRTFSLTIQYPEDYPRSPLRLKFETPVYHPNVSEDGQVYLGELEKDQWSPAITARTVLLSLQAMLSDPDPLENVLNYDAAIMMLEDMLKFQETAREWQGADG